MNIVEYKENSDLKEIDLHYGNETKINDVAINGNRLQYNFESGDYIMVNGLNAIKNKCIFMSLRNIY